MCQFLSFVITKDERVLVGDLSNHFGIESGWKLKPGEYFEAEWTEDDSGKSLTVRGEDKSWWKAVVLSKYPTRTALLKSITIGKIGGTTRWFQNGVLHCDDGPAIVWPNGDKQWFRNGKLHCDDGPAIICASGTKVWYQNNKRHRDDGPAVVCANGTKEWYKNDKRHRIDGPAIEQANGNKFWFQNGVRVEEKLVS